MLIGRDPGTAARLPFAKTALLAALLVSGLPVQAADAPTADDVRTALDSGPALRVDGQPLRAEVLREFYAPIEFEPVWGTGPGGVARSTLALDALRGARDHGLVPAHYGLAALRRRAEPASLAMAVQRELLLTDSLLRYAVDVRAGRLRPATAQPDWDIAPPDREDPVRELAEAVEAGTLGAWLEGLPPTHAGYARLVTALRALHAAADRAGKSAAEPKIRQIAVNLERWRWLPRRFESRHLVVNTADATMAVIEDGKVRLASRVVVGDELHPTPVVRSELGAIVFNPTWTVPTSIVVDEFLPKLRVNPRFLADNDIVILDRREDPHGVAIDWTAVPTTRFPFRLQQRPGGWNPLGRMRFATPNRFDVYLHDTPLPELFQRDDRALSHGCVRVERARELAALVLAGQPTGRPDALTRAMAPAPPSVVTVARPLPVYLLYWTAFVDDEGRLQLVDDPYDRDARVAAGLARASVVATRPRRGRPVLRLRPGRGNPPPVSGRPHLDRRAVLRLAALAAIAPWARRAWTEGGPESEPRALAFRNLHTGESVDVVYRADGELDYGALREIDWVLRDFRTGEARQMDRRLLHLLWRLRTALDTTEPYEVISGYRSPKTNAMLRREGRGVSRASLHMQAMAIDVRVPGCSLTALRDAALALRLGGVGYYGSSDFVHVDVGRVRFW